MSTIDFASVELRALGIEDPEMLAAARAGMDIHTFTASKIFGVPYAEVTYEQRRFGKQQNFARACTPVHAGTPTGRKS